MWEVISYLNDPILVVKVQNYLGISRRSKEQENGISIKQKQPTQNENNGLVRRKLEAVSSEDSGVSSESDSESSEFVIKNRFWYYLFCFGTILGDEIFYASFIPFWFWNIDGAVGRRVVLVWAIVMYIGQGIKDIIRWPRPACPPVIRVQKKWALEYGMPSTHAMVGLSIPFSVLLYTMNRYQYSVVIGAAVTVIWCVVVCVSRLYLGMHSVLDVIAGILLAILLMVPMVPIADALDYILLTGRWSPYIAFVSTVVLVIFSPRSDRWTPTRGDTTVVLGVSVGIQIGAWMNYKLGFMKESPLLPPYSVIWPSFEMMGLILLRTVIGFCCIVATRACFKWASYCTACALLKLDRSEMKHRDVNNSRQVFVELSYKFITYFALGINTSYLLPNTFRLIGIERPTFYTEI